MQLGEHYLRTPVTLVVGGAEALTTPGQAPDATQRHITALGQRLRDDVEAAISRITSSQPLAQISDAVAVQPRLRLWLSPGLLVPVAGFFAMLAVTQYLVENIRHLNVTLVNQFVQATIAGLLIVVFYQILRRRQLHARETSSLRRTLDHQRAVDDARNAFIRDNTLVLTNDVQQLLAAISSSPKSGGFAAIQEGCERLHKVANQFTVASHLAVGQSQEALTSVAVADIFSQAQAMAAASLGEHHTRVETHADVAEVYCRQRQWLPFVLGSLLDNAASYSADGASVELGATTDRVSVTDHGAGIPPDILRDLFKPFVKGEGALEFNHQGLGFSLYLDKLIMTYMGGDIVIDSTVGKGTTTTLLLPTPALATATV